MAGSKNNSIWSKFTVVILHILVRKPFIFYNCKMDLFHLNKATYDR